MALVIVGERAGAPALQREAWLGAIQGLDLALLIQREDDRPLGRLQVQPDDIAEFFHEGGVGRQLERPDPVGAQPMGLPDARNRGVMETGHLGHQPRTPMRAAARRTRPWPAVCVVQSCLTHGVQPRVLTLHSDRGAPMTSQCTAQLRAVLERGPIVEPASGAG